MQTLKRERRRYQKDAAPADDILTLIQLVRQNPALYNYKLQPNQRRRVDVLNGWAQIASQIGNKYSVEECRRKWKNLRDTYHQYRLRKPKFGDGLAKWRYAKELDFLSNIYQPKLKSHRQQYDPNQQDDSLLQHVKSLSHSGHDSADDIVHHSNITLVNDDAETFILTTYEESVNDDVTSIDHGSNMELPHHTVIQGVEIVKNEHVSSLDDDGATSAEVDYEEVCLYEESGNTPSVDTETIIGAGNSPPSNSKTFQYIDANDFGITSINGNTQLSSSNSSIIGGGSKLKNIPSPSDMIPVSSEPGVDHSITSSLNTLQFEFAPSKQTREELDLFFDFLKKKIQRFSCEEITSIQVEFLNCVLRREAESIQKNIITE